MGGFEWDYDVVYSVSLWNQKLMAMENDSWTLPLTTLEREKKDLSSIVKNFFPDDNDVFWLCLTVGTKTK